MRNPTILPLSAPDDPSMLLAALCTAALPCRSNCSPPTQGAARPTNLPPTNTRADQAARVDRPPPNPRSCASPSRRNPTV